MQQMHVYCPADIKQINGPVYDVQHLARAFGSITWRLHTAFQAFALSHRPDQQDTQFSLPGLSRCSADILFLVSAWLQI